MKYFSVLKSNVESEDNINSIVRSLNHFEKMIKFWLNKTAEESYENEFDWKRKKLKEFLNQKWPDPPSFLYIMPATCVYLWSISIFIIHQGKRAYNNNNNPIAVWRCWYTPAQRKSSIHHYFRPKPPHQYCFLKPLIHQEAGGGDFVKPCLPRSECLKPRGVWDRGLCWRDGWARWLQPAQIWPENVWMLVASVAQWFLSNIVIPATI